MDSDAYVKYLETFFSSPSTMEAPPLPTPLDVTQGLTTASPPLGSSSSTHQPTHTHKWGIMGAGRVSHDFVQALQSVPGAVVTAIGASTIDKAQAFAKTHSITHTHGSYAALAADPEVEIVYIGTLHAFHKEHALLAINAGKHVLVEKPATCTSTHTQEIVEAAKAKGVFFLEGMWTRFFPVVEMARHLISTGAIGKIVALHADFGFNSSDSEDYPSSPFFQRQLGGGGLLFVGVYPISMAPLCFGSSMPTHIAAAGVKDTQTGVDLSGGVTLNYDNKGICVLTYNLMGETPEETTIVGTEGRIKILGPAHCPTKMLVSRKKKGRANVSERVFEYTLPEDGEKVKERGGFNYPNSQGFAYEAAAVQRCVEAGLKEAPQYTREEAVVVGKIMDEVRRQLGVKAVDEESK